MKYIHVVICAFALAACSREVHIASQLDQASKSESTNQAAASSHAEQHAQAQEHVEDHGQERLDENVVTTQSGGAIDFVGTITEPNGTKLNGHFRKAPVKVKVDARKHDNVQKGMTEDASSMFDAKEDTASKTTGTTKTDTTTKAKTTKTGETKPDIIGCGFFGGWWLALVAVGAGFLLWPRRAKILELAKKLLRQIPVIGLFL